MLKTRNKCRICLKFGKSLPSIYAPTQRCYLPAIIRSISGVHISKRKEPHAKICAVCQRAVMQAEAIIKQCQETQQYLLYLKCELRRLRAVKALQKQKLAAAAAEAEAEQTTQEDNEEQAHELLAVETPSSEAEQINTQIPNEQNEVLDAMTINDNDDLPLYNKQTCMITTPLSAYNFAVELPGMNAGLHCGAILNSSSYQTTAHTANETYATKKHLNHDELLNLDMDMANTTDTTTNESEMASHFQLPKPSKETQHAASSAASSVTPTTDLELQYMNANGLLDMHSSTGDTVIGEDAAYTALQGLLALEWLTVRPVSAVKSQNGQTMHAPAYTKPEITLEPVGMVTSKKRLKVSACTQTEFSNELEAFELEHENSLDIVIATTTTTASNNTTTHSFPADLAAYAHSLQTPQANLEAAHATHTTHTYAANTNGYLTTLDTAAAMDYVTQLTLLNAHNAGQDLCDASTTSGTDMLSHSSSATLSLATQMELLELPKQDDDVAMLLPNCQSYSNDYLEAVTANRPVHISLAVPPTQMPTSTLVLANSMTDLSSNDCVSANEQLHALVQAVPQLQQQQSNGNERQCITPISIIETCSESSLSSNEQKPPQCQTQVQFQAHELQSMPQPEQQSVQHQKNLQQLEALLHNNAPLLYCQHCDFKTSKRRQYITHQWSAHQLRDETPYQCDRCEARFRFRTWLQKHVQLKHRHTQIVKPLFKCHKCGRMLASEKRLDFHLERLHSEGSKSHTCPVAGCEQVFDRIFSLRRHVELKHCAKQRFHCAECDKYFNLRENLRYHFEVVHQNSMKQCPHCAQKFRLQQKLDQHIATAECKNYRYSCNHCGRRFNALVGLRKHVTNIHGEGRSVVHITLTRTDDD